MIPFVADPDFTLFVGDVRDVLRELPDESVQACVTSPPYLDARIEYASPSDFSDIFAELARVVTDACLLNVGRIWRKGIEQLWWTDLLYVAQHSGWHLIDTLVWIKPNANPIHGAVFADSHEYVLVLARPGCRLNENAIRRPHADATLARFSRHWMNHRGVKGRPDKNRKNGGRPALNPLGARPRSYAAFHVGVEKGNPHPAPMPLAVAEHLVALATFPDGVVLDPFAGSGTTNLAARRLGRRSIGIELNPDYARMAARRLSQLSLLAGGAA